MDFTDLEQLHGMELARAVMREVHGLDGDPPAPDRYRFGGGLTHPSINIHWAFDVLQAMRARYGHHARGGTVPEFLSGWMSASGVMGQTVISGHLKLRGEPDIALGRTDDCRVCYLREALYLARRLRASGITVERLAPYRVPVAKRDDSVQSDGMCGRFYISRSVVQRMREQNPNLFSGLEDQVIEQVTGGDVRPTNQILTIASGPQWKLMRWGWKRDFNAAVINARTDKLTGRFWNKALRERRCVIVAEGFYEWQAAPKGKKKQPMAIQQTDPGPMIFAGLWEDNKELGLCATIVTTDAPKIIVDIHDRCPAILDKQSMEAWLDEGTSAEDALALCVPYKGDMAAWECWSPSKDVIPRPADPSDGKRETRSMF